MGGLIGAANRDPKLFGGMLAREFDRDFLGAMLYEAFQRLRERLKNRFGGSEREVPHPRDNLI